MSYSHIPLEDMLEDLRITNEEITQYEKENDVLKGDYQRNRVTIYMNEGRILQRNDFVKKLEEIIKETYPNYNL
jgi:hypothetical protein